MKSELYRKYVRTAKPRRPAIYKKAGFTNEEDYLNWIKEDSSTEGSPESEKFFKKSKSDSQKLDMVICFDTTGSMSSYIASVRKHVQDLIPKLFDDNEDLLLKIVAFGDYCDMSGPDNFGNAYQETKLTNNQNELISFVENAKNTGGGDGDEFYELVIKKVTEETPWREGSKKAVILIGDAQPHPVGYTYSNIVRNAQINWKDEARKSSGKGIQWDTFSCGFSGRNFYKELSEMTNGKHLPFSSSEKTQQVLYAATAARGGEKAKAAFRTSFAATMDSGDSELIGTYKTLSSLLDD